VLAQLIRAVEREAKNIGVSQLLAYAAEPSVEDYLGRLGYRKMQLTVWEKKL
jgi:N-acetylglutamate synthase-like GNAT family acetyltransferase